MARRQPPRGKRGECPTCGWRGMVTFAGMIRAHRQMRGDGTLSGRICDGSGNPAKPIRGHKAVGS